MSSFVYDANDQLTKETLPDGTMNTYKYDEVGNRTASEVSGEKATFTYNDANQIATKNETAYTYDKDGNLLQDEHYKYTYNQQQRLTKVTMLDDLTIALYTYDENGLRLTKTVGDKTHEYFYNDEVLDMEVVKVKDVITEYRSYEWSGYTPLGMMVKAKNGSGTFETNTYQFITNHRGDVLSIRDKDDKEVGAYTYDAYGNVLTVEGDLAKANPIRYAGYYYDEETKNYYLQARYYNPANGAFLALDPHPGDEDDPLSQNGEAIWLIAQGIYGAIDNSYSYVWSVFKKSNYKFKKTWNNLNKKKLTTLVITGALIGMLGGTFGKYLAKARVGVINRLFVKYQWEFKAE